MKRKICVLMALLLLVLTAAACGSQCGSDESLRRVCGP